MKRKKEKKENNPVKINYFKHTTGSSGILLVVNNEQGFYKENVVSVSSLFPSHLSLYPSSFSSPSTFFPSLPLSHACLLSHFTLSFLFKICNIGSSTKVADKHKIGKKGIGFKSVFKVYFIYADLDFFISIII
jgi:hypothetical protein